MTASMIPTQEYRRSALVILITALVVWALVPLGLGSLGIFASGLGATVATERHFRIAATGAAHRDVRRVSAALCALVWIGFLVLNLSRVLL